MNRRRKSIFGGAMVLTAMVVVTAGCGSVVSTQSALATARASSSVALGKTGFALAMAGPVENWRTSFQAGAMKFAVPGTVVGASTAGGPVALVASGDAVLDSAPMAVDDAFHIGSMTKLFTAALIMQLDQEGVLSITDTIDTWFPAAPNGSKINVAMLLEHESGLYELDFELVGAVSNQALVDNVFAQTPIAEPGTEYQYLNAGYIILGRIAEEAGGRPYADLVQTRFIKPLDLRSTYLDGDGDGDGDLAVNSQAAVGPALTGYDLSCDGATGSDCLGKPSTLSAVDASPQWAGAWSAGAMVSTARDQTIWLRALVAGNVVDEAHRQLMQNLTPLSSAYYSAAYGKAGIPPVQLGEGAGLATWSVPGIGNCLGHAGSIPGSNGFAAYCPDHDLSIAVLNNVNPAGTAPGYPGLLELTPAALQAIHG